MKPSFVDASVTQSLKVDKLQSSKSHAWAQVPISDLEFSLEAQFLTIGQWGPAMAMI